jgi:uncharacterized protein
MEIIGYLASAFIGISLGLIGGGGSILTVPVLVYLFGVEPVLATAYSLFVVGISSAVGVSQKWQKKQVNFRVALIFGIPSIIIVYAIRKVLIPLIPDVIYASQNLTIHKGPLTLVLFALLMIGAAIAMLKPKVSKSLHGIPSNYMFIIQGVLVGIVSGLLGAGGGFIIIPSLIFFASLEVKEAIGTSLLIIAANSLIGFTGDLSHFTIDWPVLLPVTGLAVAGIFIGSVMANRISAEVLRKAFGWFVLAMGLVILIKELFF